MASATSRLLSEILELPRSDRAELATRLLQSLDDDGDADAESAWVEELERRAATIAQGAAELVPWDEVRERVRAELTADREAARR